MREGVSSPTARRRRNAACGSPANRPCQSDSRDQRGSGISALSHVRKNPGAFAPGFPFLNRARRSPVAGDLEATFESIATTLKGRVEARPGRSGDKAIRRLGLALHIERFKLEIEIRIPDRNPVGDHADEPAVAVGDDRTEVRVLSISPDHSCPRENPRIEARSDGRIRPKPSTYLVSQSCCPTDSRRYRRWPSAGRCR